jgi:hypothetical protein
MENKTTYTQKEYAQIKGVTPQYIYKLMKKQKLLTTFNESNTKALIVDCEANDKLFKKSIK